MEVFVYLKTVLAMHLRLVAHFNEKKKDFTHCLRDEDFRKRSCFSVPHMNKELLQNETERRCFKTIGDWMVKLSIRIE